MSAILTTAGSAHLVELAAGGSLTNEFDALAFSTGNETPSDSDNLGVFGAEDRLSFVLRRSDGFPKQGDIDARNAGRGASTWTWRFERNAGEPFVASNAAVTNFSGGALLPNAPLLVSAKQVIAQRFDERLIVWVNVAVGGEVAIFTAREDALEGRIQRVVGFVARNRALSSHPQGSVIDSTTVHSRASKGQHVWTAADVVGINGAQLLPGDVSDFTLTVEKLQASTGRYSRIGSDNDLDCSRQVSGAYHFADSRWNASGGYNVSHTWTPPRGSQEATFKLTYRMVMCDDDVREWSNIVEVR